MTCLGDDAVLGLATGSARIDAETDAHLDDCESCRALVAQVAASHAPARVGAYALGELLGAGAMGRVYRAVQPGVGRDVAIKLLPGGDLREAQAMGKLAHPNVVTVFEVGEVGEGGADGVYLAMELVDGRDLRAFRGRPWRELVPLLAGVARGLAAVHAAGLVHRDVKPDNVVVGTDGRPRVADFGLAAIEGAGTPAYMAPDVLRGAPATAASDQYSFGVMAHELLAGRRPSVADEARALRPGWLGAIVRRCLAQGYADLDEAARALERGARRRTRRLVVIAASAALAVTAASLAWVVVRSPDSPRSLAAPVLLGEARALRGSHQLPLAADAARAALVAAERDHDDDAASEAWVLRVAIAGDRRDLAAADDLGVVAAAAVARAGAPAPLVDELARQRGLVALDRGDLTAASTHLEAARAKTTGTSGARTLAVARDDAALGLVARARGDYATAERELRAALELDRALHGDIARDLHDLAGVLRIRGDLAGAEPLYREALALETGADAGLTHNSLALIAMARGDWTTARAELVQASALLGDHADLGLVEHNLGLVAFATGDRAGARAHYARAEAIYARTIGPDAEAAVRLREDVARAQDPAPGPTAIPPPTPPSTAAPKPRDVGAYGARQPW